MILPVFLLIERTQNPSGMDAYASYKKLSQIIFARYGGITIADYLVEKSLATHDTPTHISVLSFPNREVIGAMLKDPRFARLKPLKQLGVKQQRIYQSVEPLAHQHFSDIFNEII